MKMISRIPDRPARGGIVGKLLLWIVVLGALAAIAWILLLPRVAASQIHSKTGFVANVDHLSLNPFTGSILVRGLVLKNPPDWPSENFVELREFKTNADITSFFSNRITADEVVMDIAKFTLVKNKEGVFNAKVFSDALANLAPAGESKQPAGPQKEFLIRHLVLKFDKLVYDDRSGSDPVVKEYDLNLHQDLTDVDSVAKIIKPITSASIGVLADVLGGTVNGRTHLLKDAAEAIKKAGKASGEKLKGLLDSLDKKKP